MLTIKLCVGLGHIGAFASIKFINLAYYASKLYTCFNNWPFFIFSNNMSITERKQQHSEITRNEKGNWICWGKQSHMLRTGRYIPPGASNRFPFSIMWLWSKPISSPVHLNILAIFVLWGPVINLSFSPYACYMQKSVYTNIRTYLQPSLRKQYVLGKKACLVICTFCWIFLHQSPFWVFFFFLGGFWVFLFDLFFFFTSSVIHMWHK